MGKFTFGAPPPIKILKIKVEEWDPEEEFIISELRATECQEVVAIAAKAQKEQTESSRGIELYADLLSRCLSTSDGEKPSKEWLMSSAWGVLKRLGDEAMKFNALNPEEAKTIEKN